MQTDFPNYNNDQINYYFRTTFTLQTNLPNFRLLANTVIDDGAVLYINGTEVLRIRMPSGPIVPLRHVVWPLAVAQVVVWAAMFYSFPALILEWERDMGWSKTALSGALTLSLVLSAVLAPVVGRLIDHGYARVVFPGCALLGAACLLLLSGVSTRDRAAVTCERGKSWSSRCSSSRDRCSWVRWSRLRPRSLSVCRPPSR